MILINPYKAGLAATEWHNLLETYLREHEYHDAWITGIKGANGLTTNEVEKGVQLVNDFFTNLAAYSKASEYELLQKTQEYDANIKSHEQLHLMLKQIFIHLYEAFSAYQIEVDNKLVNVAYHILNILNLRTCPYCNRNYTFTVFGKHKNIRPQFDHFFDKVNYPILAVSFYNLVPSCPICNYIKRNDSLHFNPFFYEFTGKFKVFGKDVTGTKDEDVKTTEPLNNIEVLNTDDWGKIRLHTSVEEENIDLEMLGLDGLYQKHDDYLKEIIEKVQAYNDHACEALVNSFQGAGHSSQQVKEFVWGKDIANARNQNHPLSKLTRDFLEQAGILQGCISRTNNK